MAGGAVRLDDPRVRAVLRCAAGCLLAAMRVRLDPRSRDGER
ncbi:hypothetical protein ABIC28_002242 [Rhodococcus sp. PvR044]|jgi:hypothetical protein|nr:MULTISPECIES: hypothetical protein [unclassified Rhodococcus (in: high G+C Gram-positive bacteria)]PTR42867.1 hypothetical protein C8K38_110166 [Rhodococcus sp. OK611]SNX91776.1 hypothetical protein SAMN05447004_11161 [Rhodococcus sp. OK270]